MIDLRSDTVTKPTKEMLEMMYHAKVGDDGYQEDPTVNELEKVAAELLGKEAALFVTSGTQGNQIAILAHTKPGEEIIVDDQSHIYCSELEAVESLARVQVKALSNNRGVIPLQEVKKAITENTTFLSVENTHARTSGSILPIDYLKELYSYVKSRNIVMHMDGARLFHAAVALGVDVQAFTKYTDTVSICLSKGLGAPVGSILAGSEAFITTARKWRRNLGGRMRQAGYLAAPGLYALQNMVERLQRDHELAQELGNEIRKIDGLTLEFPVKTNILLVNCEGLSVDAKTVASLLKKHHILAKPHSDFVLRLVIHKDIRDKDINIIIKSFHSIVQSILL